MAADDAGFAEVVSRLDGLPLAIELAAARLPLLGAEGLAEALDEPLTVLRGGRRGGRHRSLEDVIRWSYDSLGPEERRLFEWVSVFAGGVEAAAIGAVCGTTAGGISTRASAPFGPDAERLASALAALAGPWAIATTRW